MRDYFADDKEWVKFRCLEVAAERKKLASVKEVISDAEEFLKFVLPRAEKLQIKGGKDAPQIRKK